MLRIAITGSTGKMGQIVGKMADKHKEIETIVLIDEADNLANFIDEVDVVIDFTRPEASLKYLKICAAHNRGIIIGTTGFSSREITTIHSYAQQTKIMLAPNMSIGVNVVLKLLATATQVLGNTSDIEIVETHHRHKIDAPSGTALQMGEAITSALGRDLTQCAVYDRSKTNTPRENTTIGFSAIRGGDVVGEHTALFFMNGERIEITHKASSREIFANGAIRASIWLNKINNNGVYSMTDVLDL